ncbi:unnamed protein product [Symbiodinium sp. CCMP2592]|nr:unnamed protein product [Symbiodinium sp. CCMP2592]
MPGSEAGVQANGQFCGTTTTSTATDLVTPPRRAVVHAPPPAAPEASGQQMVKAEKPEEVELPGVKREVDSPPCTPPRKVPVSLAMFPFRTPPRLRRGFQLRGYLQVRTCDLQMRERLRTLLCRGWPSSSPSEGATRDSISELLGLCPSTGKPGAVKATTYLAWALPADGRRAGALVGAAVLSVYRYRGRRRCGCLEFITSRRSGAGAALLRLATRFLQAQQIDRLYSGVDLSRPNAFEAHRRWGFRVVEEQEWAHAGLAFYRQGDVRYMLLDLSADPGQEAVGV